MIDPVIDPVRARDHFLPREVDAFCARLGDADLDAPVPSCPGWSVRDLVIHVGNVHRWVIQAMTTGDAHGFTPAVGPDQELTRWYPAVAAELQQLFASREPQSPCWTFGMPPGTAAFWFRRQCHEIAVHRWDLAAAAGTDTGYDPVLAVDGLDEVARIFFPRQVALGRTEPLRSSLAVVPGDGGPRWVFAGDGTAPPTRADVTLSGPADALLLLIWGRIPLDDERIRINGSAATARAVLSAGLVP